MVRDLDDITFSEWFLRFGGSRGSIERMWDPIAYALGFIDCDHMSARCMLTIFQLFAIRSEASVLRMCEGSPNTYVHEPIVKYLKERDVKINLNSKVVEILHTCDADGKPNQVQGISVEQDGGEAVEKKFDVLVCAQDVPGIKKLLPESFRKHDMFDKIYTLVGVPVATVQLRFDGWVTELQDMEALKNVKGDLSDGKAPGLDNLLYSADAEFSCFADLAITSPAEYYKPGEGSLLQCVLTPADRFMAMDPEEVAKITADQVYELFPSAKEQGLKVTWSNVVKLQQSLYREAPGMDKFRPDQRTVIPNFYLSGSYTYQDYIDSMEGATKSGLLTADKILSDTDYLAVNYQGLADKTAVA
jgi:zeta-carotene desaturase